MNIHEHRFIFVCGLHRSGTSILFKSIREHPQISGFMDTKSPENEGMHLQTVYKPSGYYGGAGKFGFNPASHLTETSTLISEKNRAKLFSEWSKYWDLSKPFLLEKSPPNLIRTRFLQEMFPQSYFIIFIRHPIAVSLATRTWYKSFKIYWRRLPKILEHWLICHEIFFNQDKQHLKNVHILKYEHFVNNPNGSLSAIFDFLGLEDCETKQKILPTVNEKYFSLWKNMQDSLISRHTIRKSIEKYEKRIRAFGYSLEELPYLDSVQIES